MSLWIKICGLKTAAAIEAAAEAGAQAVGFVFYERSPRNLDLATAAQLQSVVPSGLERVAVFLNPSQVLLDSVIEAVAPDWIQTDIRDLAKLRWPGHQKVLPVMRTGQAFPDAFPPRVLLESARSGAGETADWQVFPPHAGHLGGWADGRKRSGCGTGREPLRGGCEFRRGEQPWPQGPSKNS